MEKKHPSYIQDWGGKLSISGTEGCPLMLRVQQGVSLGSNFTKEIIYFDSYEFSENNKYIFISLETSTYALEIKNNFLFDPLPSEEPVFTTYYGLRGL